MTLDWTINECLKEIPIKESNQNEVKYVVGKSKTTGKLDEVLIFPETTNASNYGFDVTPARLITALLELFPEQH